MFFVQRNLKIIHHKCGKPLDGTIELVIDSECFLETALRSASGLIDTWRF